MGSDARDEPLNEPGRERRVKRIDDARQLRALAHPLRNRLLWELSACGQAGVSELAGRLGEPVNSVSYHLRQLAAHGFIEEAPELARDGRDRWWRMPYSEGFDYPEGFWRSPEVREAKREFTEFGIQVRLREIAEAFPSARDEGNHRARDWPMRMSEDEVEQFNDELIALLMRWGDRTKEAIAAGDTEGRRTLTFYSFLFPTRPVRSDRPDPPGEAETRDAHPDVVTGEEDKA